MKNKIRSKALSAILWLYNAVAFLLMNVIFWRNHLWNTGKWTKYAAESD